MNKIMRASYGSQVEYQNLALDAISQFKKWNQEIQSGKTLPPGFTTSNAIFVNNGNLTMNDDESLTQFDIDTMKNMTAAGFNRSQIILTEPDHVDQAKKEGFGFAINPFNRSPEQNYGLLDTCGGMVYADLACRFALHKAETLGVRLFLGGRAGTFSKVVHESTTNKVTGVQTADGGFHQADLVIMACGGWTPTLVPELDGLCETTAGSVSIFQLPEGNQELWDRFAPERFPTWKYVYPITANPTSLDSSKLTYGIDTKSAMEQPVASTASPETLAAESRSAIAAQSSPTPKPKPTATCEASPSRGGQQNLPNVYQR